MTYSILLILLMKIQLDKEFKISWPEVMRAQHLCVIHDFALVGGDLQAGQNIIHPWQAGGSWGCRAMEAPLEDVEARPAGYMGALFQHQKGSADLAFSSNTRFLFVILSELLLPVHFLPLCRWGLSPPCCNLCPAPSSYQSAEHSPPPGRWCHELLESLSLQAEEPS